MPSTAHILQPIVYDTMVLAQALKDLKEFGKYNRKHALFPKRECALTSACTRIRTLAEFWGGGNPTGKRAKEKDVITVDDPGLKWTADKSFYSACWEAISNYVDHPLDARYKKHTKRPTVHFANRWGRRILRKTKREIDRRTELGELKLSGDAKVWYHLFNGLFQDC